MINTKFLYITHFYNNNLTKNGHGLNETRPWHCNIAIKLPITPFRLLDLVIVYGLSGLHSYSPSGYVYE